MLKIKLIPTALVLTAAMLILGGCGASTPTSTSSKTSEVKVFQGSGQTSVFRSRVDKTTQKESFSTTTVSANALFDKDNKVISVQFDSLEIVPESEKEGGTIFPGWPTATLTNDVVTKDVSDWKTKRERGDAAYGMDWSVQIDAYQEFFKGKTVAEIEQWFAKNTSDTNGKPLTDKVTSDPDKAKFAALSDAEKTALVDVTSGASISLKDGHGDFIGALKKAFENKVEVAL
ncbi:MAG TPA: FMN-binding protein [Desulfosporosinus sp.]|nr:FMN-binding protein [Desulfosporosinus sp.]